MGLAILVFTFGNDTNRLALKVRQFIVGLEDDVADFACIWASQGSVGGHFSNEWFLWLEEIVWWFALVIDVVNLGYFLGSVLKE